LYLSNVANCLEHVGFANIQGKPKTPQHENHNILKMREYFCTKFLLIYLEHNCAKVCCSVLYLLDIGQVDGNANLGNEFCNCADCTKSWFYY